MRVLFGFILLILSNVAFAKANYTTDLGVGFTNNANLEAQNKDSDLFLRVQAQASTKLESHGLGLRLAYTDFAKQNVNDNFGYRLFDKWAPTDLSWVFSGAILGRKYTNGAPGYTDTSFDSFGWDLKAEQQKMLNTQTTFSYGPSLRARYYSGAAKRADHNVFGFVDFTYETSENLTLGASGELGFLASSNSQYSQLVFDVGGNIEYALGGDLRWFNEVNFGRNSFTNRSVDVATTVSRRRGVIRKSTSVENETFGVLNFVSELTKSLNQSVDGKISVSHSKQTSKSGYQDYGVTELYLNFVLKF